MYKRQTPPQSPTPASAPQGKTAPYNRVFVKVTKSRVAQSQSLAAPATQFRQTVRRDNKTDANTSAQAPSASAKGIISGPKLMAHTTTSFTKPSRSYVQTVSGY